MIIIERILNAPVEMVWKAITNKDEMKQWYFDIPAFKPQVGLTFQFIGRGKKGDEFIHLCEVIEVIGQKKLTYSWQYQGYEGKSFVTFELSPEGTKTKLKLTHAGLETFPASIPDFAEANFEEGWSAIIGKFLPDYLEKKIT